MAVSPELEVERVVKVWERSSQRDGVYNIRK